MDSHILSFELRALVKAINRHLGETMPESARIATGGNARIIMFLARNRDEDVYQHTIERKFCITRSTASRVLALMEKKGLIARESVAHDARLKKIVLTAKADSIVATLQANGERMERRLVEGFTDEERAALMDYVQRMRANVDAAQREFEEQSDRNRAGYGIGAADMTEPVGPPDDPSGSGEPAPDGTDDAEDMEDKKEENE
ncbi:MarR family transcriptional regulator [Bifidobacterium sp. MA2]|uniref:MarR family transcriptional regulator n=1 Tax=Bifidobacterium santillanense TaxID=2809028 RepID=A0ABS5UPK9_9BIFI|nr:MarR family transcriptional regulator [Bifidobacterium santillanense]MBT1172804.1 MarR family transcriptional regulator [Bifidobacterium santillanense]